MTFSESRISHTLSRTAVLLKKNLWAWPVIAVVLLSIVGYSVHSAIEFTMKESLKSELKTLLNAETAMLDRWYKVQSSRAESAATNLQFREAAYQLLAREESDEEVDEAASIKEIHKQLEKALLPTMASQKFVGFFVTDRSHQILDASNAVLIGQKDVPQYNRFLTRALNGETVVSTPFPSVVMMKNEDGEVRTGEPTMYACTPLRDADFQVVGTLALQLRPELEFTEILQVGRIGESGETYAFNRDGAMVSNSRFDQDLILLGILPDQEHSHSILNVQIRDPQGNMTEGFRPNKRRSEMPLTAMAASAINGNSEVNVDGYNDYRGVPVTGAWTWLPEYEIGVTTEIDVAEAFHALTILKRTFFFLYALLIASSVAIFVFTIIVARLQREARKSAIEAQQLGQYKLEEKLGAGAMGVVYRGHHAMLRRATAIKLLDVDKVNPSSIERFEREVQITCQLHHPSTIQVYDFGRTPEGVFYYAMEYLDGIDLEELVEKDGPQPAGRVIHVLLQACGSLFEAHSKGLVHRDIKPANIMLNRRGGESDVVKVLDFGLVKAVDDKKQANLTGENGLTGTPLYMSPEAIQSPMSVDARSDLYGLGAVGYFLLTGKTVFDANSIIELCKKHVDEAPIPPSERLGKPVSSELENALLMCLEKARSLRPQTAKDLAALLQKCPEYTDWSSDKADAWWRKHERGQSPQPEATQVSTPPQSGFDQTMDT
ncbi:MAG: serine/threonine protein kinase [Blastopirellula sp.]|nr:MAG: serine/threonine protein kinase [Blastopirellula sp.]